MRVQRGHSFQSEADFIVAELFEEELHDFLVGLQVPANARGHEYHVLVVELFVLVLARNVTERLEHLLQQIEILHLPVDDRRLDHAAVADQVADFSAYELVLDVQIVPFRQNRHLPLEVLRRPPDPNRHFLPCSAAAASAPTGPSRPFGCLIRPSP